MWPFRYHELRIAALEKENKRLRDALYNSYYPRLETCERVLARVQGDTCLKTPIGMTGNVGSVSVADILEALCAELGYTHSLRPACDSTVVFRNKKKESDNEDQQ